MTFQTVGLVAATLGLIPGVTIAETRAALAPPALVVRTYRNVDISDKDFRTALTYAEAAFASAGVALVWMDCTTTSRAQVDATACSTAVASNEIVLRVQAAGRADSPHSSMGVSLVNTQLDSAPPMISAVFVDRVTVFARVAGVDARRVLGYACAHEIGHLLLNRPGHSETGLMRAIFSRLEVQRNRPADWVFPAEDAEIIRNAVLARAALQ